MRRLLNDYIRFHLTTTLRLEPSDDDLAIIRLHLVWCLPGHRMVSQNIVEAEEIDAGGDDKPPGEYSNEQAARLRRLVSAATPAVGRLLRTFVNALSMRQRRQPYYRSLVSAVQQWTATAIDIQRRTALCNILTGFGLSDARSANAFARANFAQHVQHALVGQTLNGGELILQLVCFSSMTIIVVLFRYRNHATTLPVTIIKYVFVVVLCVGCRCLRRT